MTLTIGMLVHSSHSTPTKDIANLQLIPQIIINVRRHNATGLQPTRMFLWACAGVPLGVYNIVKNFNVALQIQYAMSIELRVLTAEARVRCGG
jgi:hypothetical protein